MEAVQQLSSNRLVALERHLKGLRAWSLLRGIRDDLAVARAADDPETYFRASARIVHQLAMDMAEACRHQDDEAACGLYDAIVEAYKDFNQVRPTSHEDVTRLCSEFLVTFAHVRAEEVSIHSLDGLRKRFLESVLTSWAISGDPERRKDLFAEFLAKAVLADGKDLEQLLRSALQTAKPFGLRPIMEALTQTPSGERSVPSSRKVREVLSIAAVRTDSAAVSVLVEAGAPLLWGHAGSFRVDSALIRQALHDLGATHDAMSDMLNIGNVGHYEGYYDCKVVCAWVIQVTLRADNIASPRLTVGSEKWIARAKDAMERTRLAIMDWGSQAGYPGEVRIEVVTRDDGFDSEPTVQLTGSVRFNDN